MLRTSLLAVLLVLYGHINDTDAQPIRDATRGELLYARQCSGCHSTQVHWREKRLVTDMASLRFEVRRWQAASSLGWSDEDIAEVARYLNSLYYHYPVPN